MSMPRMSPEIGSRLLSASIPPLPDLHGAKPLLDFTGIQHDEAQERLSWGDVESILDLNPELPQIPALKPTPPMHPRDGDDSLKESAMCELTKKRIHLLEQTVQKLRKQSTQKRKQMVMFHQLWGQAPRKSEDELRMISRTLSMQEPAKKFAKQLNEWALREAKKRNRRTKVELLQQMVQEDELLKEVLDEEKCRITDIVKKIKGHNQFVSYLLLQERSFVKNRMEVDAVAQRAVDMHEQLEKREQERDVSLRDQQQVRLQRLREDVDRLKLARVAIRAEESEVEREVARCKLVLEAEKCSNKTKGRFMQDMSSVVHKVSENRIELTIDPCARVAEVFVQHRDGQTEATVGFRPLPPSDQEKDEFLSKLISQHHPDKADSTWRLLADLSEHVWQLITGQDQPHLTGEERFDGSGNLWRLTVPFSSVGQIVTLLECEIYSRLAEKLVVLENLDDYSDDLVCWGARLDGKGRPGSALAIGLTIKPDDLGIVDCEVICPLDTFPSVKIEDVQITRVGGFYSQKAARRTRETLQRGFMDISSTVQGQRLTVMEIIDAVGSIMRGARPGLAA